MQWSKGIIHHENGEELIEYPILLDKPDLTVEGSVQPTFWLHSQKVNNSYSFKILRIVPLPDYSRDVSQVTYSNQDNLLLKTPQSNIVEPDPDQCYIVIVHWEIPYYIHPVTHELWMGAYKEVSRVVQEAPCDSSTGGPHPPVYNAYSETKHDGTDILTPIGSTLYAMHGGTVTAIRRNTPSEDIGGSYGNFIQIQSTVNGKTITLKYNHLYSVPQSLSVGSTIIQGQAIGITGKTGNAWNVPNPHVHIQARELDGSTWKRKDPETYMTTKFGGDHKPENPNPCDN